MKSRPKVIVDARESGIVKNSLIMLDTEVVEQTITPADYVLSAEFAVERKSYRDFIRSIFDGRLFEQMERLTKVYEKPMLLVEGDIYQGLSEISNPLVFWGALAKVLSEGNLSVVFTANEMHTAMLLYSLAKKLQKEQKKRIVVKNKPKVYTQKERQLLTVCSLPRIGPQRAASLLERFGSVRRIFLASEKELLSMEGIGKKTVKGIMDFLDIKYPALEFS